MAEAVAGPEEEVEEAAGGPVEDAKAGWEEAKEARQGRSRT